eukprot:14357706-Ditylum_brightwellii.AAC.1
MLWDGSGAGGGQWAWWNVSRHFRGVCQKGAQLTDIVDGNGPGPFRPSPRSVVAAKPYFDQVMGKGRSLVTQEGGTRGT